jgi:hypothetical protein
MGLNSRSLSALPILDQTKKYREGAKREISNYKIHPEKLTAYADKI